MTLHASIYLSLMGAKGLRRVNEIGYNGAHSLAKSLVETGKVKLANPDKPFLNEFRIETVAPLSADTFLDALAAHGILGGITLSDNEIIIAVTEMCTPAEIDRYVSIIKGM